MTRTLLIVEDDVDIQNYYTFLFADLELKIERALSGEDALKLLDEGVHPDLILLDVVLPGMGGEEFFRILREERKDETPVIVCSVDERMSRRVDMVGPVQGIFTKGTEGNELRDIITKALDS